MLKQNKVNSLSKRFKKGENFINKISPNELFNYLKNKRNKKPDYYSNRSIDFLKKSNNIFDIWQLNENYNQNIKNYTNRNVKIKQKIIRNYLSNDKKQKMKKFILSKKKILETLLDDERRKTIKNNIYRLNNNTNSNHIQNKRISIIDNISIPTIEFSKRNIYKIKNKVEDINCNQINTINLKKNDNNNNLLMEKLHQIKMNKMALFKKIKFAELKNFCCKDIKLNSYNTKFGVNFNLKQNIRNNTIFNFNRHEFNNYDNNNIYNCNEKKINSIKEKIQNYFIGKFDSIKDYFDDWDEQEKGKIDINDIYNYLNNKIKFPISKAEITKIFGLYYNKSFFYLEDFKNCFLEQPSNEKLFVQYDKSLKSKKRLAKSSSEGILFNNIKSNHDKKTKSYNEKYKDSELMDKQNDKLRISIKKKYKDELNNNVNNNLINKEIPENNKNYYDDIHINKLFINYKSEKNKKMIIKDYTAKNKNKKTEIKINNNTNNTNFPSSNNNKMEINKGYSSYYERKINNQDSLINRNKNNNNINTKKNMFLHKTNKLFYNKNKKYNNKNKLNNQVKEYKSQDINEDKNNSLGKNIILKTTMEKNINDKFSFTNSNIERNSVNLEIESNLNQYKYQLPIITKYTREQNKNSDIIDLL